MKKILTLLLLLPGYCFALTGNDLLGVCNNKSSDWSSAYCLGYIQGVTHGALDDAWINFGRLKLPGNEPNKLLLFCLPGGVTGKQEMDVSIQYLNVHPEKRHEDADVLVIKAMIEAFPCDKQ